MTWPSQSTQSVRPSSEQHQRPGHSLQYTLPHCYYYCKLGFEDRPCLMQLGSSTSTIGPRANIQPRWWSSQLHRPRALACLQVQFWREVRSSRSLSRGGEMYSNICLWIMPATIAMIMGVSSNLLQLRETCEPKQSPKPDRYADAAMLYSNDRVKFFHNS